jgi:hypothetical protein
MQTTQNPIGAQAREVVNELNKLAGEVRLQIHLGNMDLKKAWDELEPKLAEVDRLAEKESEEAYQTVRDMLHNLKHIHAKLPKKAAQV